MTPEQRRDLANGIWLCQNCAKLIDNDWQRFDADTLRRWKTEAEQEATGNVGRTAPALTSSQVGHEAILRMIAQSNPSDWTFHDRSGTYSFRYDVALRIVQEPPEFPRPIAEPWATRFPDPAAFALRFAIYYGGTPVRDEWAVSVDGGRAYIPFPTSASELTITAWQYAFGRVIDIANGQYDFDSYLSRAGIAVGPA